MEEWQEEFEVAGRNGEKRGRQDEERRKRREESRRLLSGEVLQAAALFKDGLGKLLKHSVHVSALPRPQPLQEADVAAVTCDEQRQVGILLHHFHWNGCERREARVSERVSDGR